MQEFALECSIWKRMFWELIKGYLSSSPTWLICCLVETCSYFIFHLIQRFQTFPWDPKRGHCFNHFHNIVDLVDSFLCTRGHYASVREMQGCLEFNCCFKSVWNGSAEDVCSSLCFLWVCHRLNLQGTQTPDVWICFTGFVCVQSRSQSHYVPIFQRTFHWKVFVPN